MEKNIDTNREKRLKRRRELYNTTENKKKAKEYRDKMKEHRKQLWKEYYSKNREEICAKKKKSRIKNISGEADRLKKYRENNKDKIALSSSEWKKKNKVKVCAHAMLQRAVRIGNVNKPEICEICHKKDIFISGHHEDYSKPLEVIWLCKTCHTDIHKGVTVEAKRKRETLKKFI